MPASSLFIDITKTSRQVREALSHQWKRGKRGKNGLSASFKMKTRKCARKKGGQRKIHTSFKRKFFYLEVRGGRCLRFAAEEKEEFCLGPHLHPP